MPELQKTRLPGTIHPNCVPLFGTIVIGGAGAISAQTGNRDSGVTFVKNASTGQYDGTIHRGYARCMAGDANMIGGSNGTVVAPNAAKQAFVTNLNATWLAGTATGSAFSILCTAADGATAANPSSGDVISWKLWVSDSK